MAQLSARFAAAVPALMRDMAIYFVQFRIVDERCLYVRLVHLLREMQLIERVVVSTLNYDCLLELALVGAGIGVDYFGTADATHSALVLKLHGSCNMFSAQLQAQGIFYGNGIVFEGGIQAWLDANRVIDHCLSGTALAPVMCLFMEGKPTSVSPRTLSDLQKTWAASVANSGLVLCVGVHPHPVDSHIWEPLATTSAHLAFVGDQDAFESWVREYRGDRKSIFLGSRFNLAFNGIAKELRRL